MADLSCPGDEYIAALGGAGGKGNRFFLANDNRAPVTCTPGQPGQERVLFLELKMVAHAGMVGVTWRREEVEGAGRRWHFYSRAIEKSVPGAGVCLRLDGNSSLGLLQGGPCAHAGARTPVSPRPSLGQAQSPEVTRRVNVSSRLGFPMQGSPRFSGPFRTRDPPWLPTRSPP